MLINSRFDDKKIRIDLNEKTDYGIMLSGGLDSAILLSLIILEFKKLNSSSIIPFSMIKHDHSYMYVNNIIDTLNKKFDVNLPSTILVGDPDINHREQSAYATRQVFTEHPHIDFLFNGVNQNPPAPWGEPHYLFPDRVKKSPHEKIIMPFVELTKKHIIDFMYQYNLEFLCDITHSCTEHKIGRCNLCFQCNERKWAFEQLEKSDTGNL